jgi:hypothetical protein
MSSTDLNPRKMTAETLEARDVPASGLAATYYDNIDFTGSTVSRVDTTVNFDWGSGSPSPSIGSDTFSARWLGTVQAVSTGTYAFRTYTDDGVRLWVNGQKLIDNWTDHAATYDVASISLTAGQKYNVKMEFYEKGGNAVSRLQWRRPGTNSFVTVPSTQLFTPSNNRAPTDVTISNTLSLTGQPIGTPVGRFTAIDPDLADTHVFTLTGSNNNNSLFSVAGAELRTAQTFNTTAAYSIQVRATDPAGGFVEKTFPITVGPAGIEYIQTEHDRIPNFGTTATVTAVASGNWSNPAVWSTRQVPGANAIVAIPSGVTVTYDQSYATSAVAPDTVVVRAGGHLSFRTDINTRLVTANLLVLAAGRLTIGNEFNPIAAGVKAEVVIANKPLRLDIDPEQFGNGLIVLGQLSIRGAAKQVWDTATGAYRDLGYATLDVAPTAGQTQLRLAQPVIGWRPGDKLVLPDTRQFHYGNEAYPTTWTETATLQSISADGRTVTLQSPLQFDHLGVSTTKATMRPHVGNLTRNVVISSENPNGTFTTAAGVTLPTRGHTFYTDRAEVDVRYAEYSELGRTTNAPVAAGTNQKGRYATHFHHLYGAAVPTSDRQYSFQGNTLSDVASPRKWPIAIHDSHYGRIEGNLVYGGTSAAIATEEGGESYNKLVGNFVLGVTGDRFTREKFRREHTELGEGADGFWLAGPNNELRDNVVASVMRAAYMMYGGENSLPFLVEVPAFQGANTHDNGMTRDTANMALLAFTNNEAYSSLMGIEIWYLGHKNYFDAVDGPMPLSVIQGGRFWHIHRTVLFGEQQNNLTIDGLVAIGDPTLLGYYENGLGLDMRQSQRLVIRNVSIEQYKVGLITPNKIAQSDEAGTTRVNQVIPTRIQNSYFRNVTDIRIDAPETDIYPFVPPNVTLIIDSQMDGETAIRRTYADDRYRNLTQIHRVFVLSYQGDSTKNYQLYTAEQAKTFVVPQSRTEGNARMVGAPLAGLTNQQWWDSNTVNNWGNKYVIFGDLLPDDAFQVGGIVGFARNLTAAEVAALRG